MREPASLYYGGCPYDLPFGVTCLQDYDTDPYESGCALGLQQYVNQGPESLVTLMEFMAAMQALFLTTLLCYFFKRKADDVTPVQGWQVMDDDGYD